MRMLLVVGVGAMLAGCGCEGPPTDAGPPPPSCGDGVTDPVSEACDGADLRGADCASLGGGFTSGALACTIVCTYDTSACAGAPSVPVLRKPFNGAYLGSLYAPGLLRPVFVWEPSTPVGAGPLSYEIELSTDRTFGAGVLSGQSGATSWGPASDLPVSSAPPVGSRYWWRVRACAGTECSPYSVPWSVHVGRTHRDFNGDGFDDVALTTYENLSNTCYVGHAFVYLGGPGANLDSIADADIPGGIDAGYGLTSAAAGDVNGDAFADLLVGTEEDGEVLLYFGGPGPSFETTADLVFSGFPLFPGLGWAVAGPGDVNDDGYADVLLGAPFEASLGNATGAALLYFGGPPFDTVADVTFASSEAGSLFGERVGGAGDVDGDGYPDLVVGAPTGTSPAGVESGNVFLYLGGPGMDATADLVFPGLEPMGQLGYTVGTAGDVNGDGFGDVLLGSFAALGLNVFLGAPTSALDALADASLTSATEIIAAVGAPAGDVNGDAFADLVAGGYSGSPFLPVDVLVFLGNATGVPVQGASLTDSLVGSGYGSAIAGAGDLNRDGFDDVLVGAPFSDTCCPDAGAAYVYLGGAGDFDDVVDVTMIGGQPNCALGTSVAP